MKQKLFTLLLLSTVGLLSCRKSQVDLNIKQFDQQQIQNYIAANGITGMMRDTVGGDTTGIYYQVIEPVQGVGGVLTQYNYTDQISLVYSLNSFDGKYLSNDTTANHYYEYLGHLTSTSQPLAYGLMLGIHNDAKYKGTKIRFLIPSHLAYGTNGSGTGSKTLTNGRIAGNQCLDYTIHIIDNQAIYDQQVIKNYMTANSLTGYTETASGLWYKITTPGTGTDPITYNSTVSLTYNGLLMDGISFGSFTTTGGVPFNIPDVVSGFQEGLELVTSGASISFIMPSALGYGTGGSTGIPPNSCLRYDCTISTVSP